MNTKTLLQSISLSGLLRRSSPLGARGVRRLLRLRRAGGVRIGEALLHLIFPHLCAGCGSDVLNRDHHLCLHCISSLPHTSFHLHSDNPVEKMFWGRIPVTSAAAQFYFTKESMMQTLVHQLKYKGHKELGIYLGSLMGQQLALSNRFAGIDALIPLPLHPSRERTRGYNQATILCEGIASVMRIPVFHNIIVRNQSTETQTHKSRLERWQNMEGRFTLTNEAAIEGKHILLVDDVITTGATLEACATELLKAKNTRLSIATLCIAQ